MEHMRVFSLNPEDRALTHWAERTLRVRAMRAGAAWNEELERAKLYKEQIVSLVDLLEQQISSEVEAPS